MLKNIFFLHLANIFVFYYYYIYQMTRKGILKKTVNSVLIFFVFSLILFAELQKRPELEFSHLSIIDGLSQSLVMSICQDRYGYMWFGTQDGLNRYDGKTFKVYKHSQKDPNSIISSNIRVVMEDSTGELWIGTHIGGLSRFRRNSDDFENFVYNENDKSSLSGNNVFAVFEDRKKALWVGILGSGLNKFDREEKKFIRYKSDLQDSSSISSDQTRTIFEDSKGQLWIGNYGGGLNKFNKSSGTFNSFFYSKSGNIEEDKIMVIFEYKPGILLIGTDGDGIKFFNTITDKYSSGFSETFPEYLKNARIRSFYKDQSGVLWITTFGNGIVQIIFNEEGDYSYIQYLSNVYKTNSLSSNQLLDIYRSREGLLYFATSGSGLNILDTEQSFFTNISTNPQELKSLNNKSVRSIFQGKENELYIGTDAGGVKILKENSVTNLVNFGKNRIFALLKDSYDDLWVGSYESGLYNLKNGEKKFLLYKNISNNNKTLSDNLIRVIFEDRDRILWIGTQNGGVNKFNRKDQTFIHYKHNKDDNNSLINNEVKSIIEDKKGKLWIGTWGGLSRFDKEKIQFLSYVHEKNNKNSLSHNQILSVFEDRNDILWIGTLGGGLNRFDPKKDKWEKYTEDNGFPNNVIYGILEEKNKKPDPVLWISTNKGIVRFDTKTKKINIYDSSSGIQANEFNGGAYFQNKKGEMYFGGINGLTKFDPSKIIDNPYAPKVCISGIKVFNKYKNFPVPVEDLKEIEFSYRENYFTIEFILLSYRGSNKNIYKYKLDGIDKDWVESDKKNRASYTNLEEGNYTFLVKGTNNDGVWSDEIAKLKIKVIPVFWKTFWFKMIFILFILISTLFFYKKRTKKLKNEKTKLETINMKLNKEISERKKVEIESKQLQEKLIQSEKMEVLGTLAGGVAHDLNNILGAIVSYPDIILMKLPDDSPLRKPVLTIQQSGKKAAAVVMDLLTLARRGVKEKKILNLNDLINELLKSPEFEKIKKENPEISINVSLDKDLYNILGSEIHISKSLINLILNSVEAIKKDGMIFISTTNIVISEDSDASGFLLKANKYAVLRILDNGEGIAQKDIKRIFDPFYTKKKMGRSGTGLGMAIISGMVTDHEGDIDIWSSLGTGTSIDIYLPATADKIEKIEDNKLIAEYTGNREKILVIDDVLLQREIATMLLEQLNYVVYTAQSGEKGLAFLKNNKVDLILLDMIMEPGIDGLTTYKRIIEINRKQKVIIASGFSKPENVEEAMELGVDSYIGKPYTIDVLGEMVKQVLKKEK